MKPAIRLCMGIGLIALAVLAPWFVVLSTDCADAALNKMLNMNIVIVIASAIGALLLAPDGDSDA